MADTKLFSSLLSELDITLTEEQMNQFHTYFEMLVEKNKVMNLTGITEYEEVLKKHFVDSLSLVKIYKSRDEVTVLDMGTGAGFPGIPLKIAFPNLKITLLDSLNKRVNFLNEVIQELGLKNINAVHGRAEEYVRKEGVRESYDLVVSRAVAKLSSLSEYCLPYVKENGYFIPYKAGSIEDELKESKNAIKILGGVIENEVSFELPASDISRTLIKIKKIKKTPAKYPRSGGKPTKEPIM